MHIPASMLNGTVCPVTTIVSSMGITASIAGAISAKKKSAVQFASISAFIFAVQMLNFPILAGTSGHIIGAALAVFLLGLPIGILSMTVVIVIQTLIFGDGGINVLGANILNMALAAPISAWIVQNICERYIKKDIFIQKIFIIGIAAWVSIITAAFLCSLEIASESSHSFITIASSMLSIHAIIGIGEAVLTIFLYTVFRGRSYSKIDTEKKNIIPILLALISGLLLSPFASSLPDGLESVSEILSLYRKNMPTFTAPMNDYKIAIINNAFISTSLATLTGIALVLIIGFFLLKIIKAISKKKAVI